MIVVLYFLALLIYVAIAIAVVRWHKSKYGDPNTFKAVVLRALVLTLCYGVGIIGDQGFAVLAPMLPAILVNRWLATIPFLLWFSIFLVFGLMQWSLRRSESSHGPK